MVLILLILPALPFALWKTRFAPLAERRRVGVFVLGLIAGSGPVIVGLLLQAIIPPIGRFFQAHSWIPVFVFRPLLITVPIAASYSVLVYHVLDVRLVIRKAFQYALARTTVYLAAAVPFAGLVVYLYQSRQKTLSSLMAGHGPMILMLAATAGLAVLWARRPVLRTIDRRFFREQHDARRILADLIEKIRTAASLDDFLTTMRDEIDRALHLYSSAILIADFRNGQLVAPDHVMRPLSLSSSLATIIGGRAEPLDVELEDPRTPLSRLTREEQDWLADGGFRLVIPLLSSHGTLLGLLALGDKKSELPYSREDRLLLTAIAASAGLSLENRLTAQSPAPRMLRPEAGPGRRDANAPFVLEMEAADECLACHAVLPAGYSRCHLCGGELEVAPVPYVLLGKFRFERRIGAGGMGVVYQALDLTLNRAVAVKTLPRISPHFSVVLRREARTMASVSHPNLAAIYGAETWRGTPLLVVELLAGGTLAARIKRGRMGMPEALDLGITMADVLHRMHGLGVLHRDIKPSNIGYTVDGMPKLLDLGLAKIIEGSRAAEDTRRALRLGSADPPTVSHAGLDTVTVSGEMAGTPAYLSPEALAGKPADVSFDLWSLAVVLFEAVAGRHPAYASTARDTVLRVMNGNLDNIAALVPQCPNQVREFFESALAREPRQRPTSAGTFGQRLRELRAGVVPAHTVAGSCP
jgi:hypothetical protein